MRKRGKKVQWQLLLVLTNMQLRDRDLGGNAHRAIKQLSLTSIATLLKVAGDTANRELETSLG